MIDNCILIERRAPSTGRQSLIRDTWCRVRTTLRCWDKRIHNRQHLAELDEHLLNDIGMSKEERSQEISKPFWRK